MHATKLVLPVAQRTLFSCASPDIKLNKSFWGAKLTQIAYVTPYNTKVAPRAMQQTDPHNKHQPSNFSIIITIITQQPTAICCPLSQQSHLLIPHIPHLTTNLLRHLGLPNRHFPSAVVYIFFQTLVFSPFFSLCSVVPLAPPIVLVVFSSGTLGYR